MKKIKSKVNSGLISAQGTQNKRIVKDTIEIMKNPIISAIKKTIQMSMKKNKKLEKEYMIAMLPSKILDIMDIVMFEKVWIDIENEEKEMIEQRQPTPFHSFMYDHMIMKFGLQSLAIKNLI